MPSPRSQLALDAARLAPPRPGNPLFCHSEFLDQLAEKRNTPVGQRASLFLRRLLLDERREFFKSTQGVNRGWRRSRLGGNHGSHFYAWWAPRGAAPLEKRDFDEAPEGSIFIRAIRHHDDHSPLDASSWQDAYLPIGAIDLLDSTQIPEPWTQQQTKFANARNQIRTLRGFPGSGKTSALWHAAESAAYEGVLYVTWSRDLAALADDYFAKLVPAWKRVRVITLPELLGLLAGVRELPEPVRSARARFLSEASGMSPRILGPWADVRGGLYDELHAHLIGSALPETISRWHESGRRLSPKDYRRLRERFIGRSAVDAALETVDALDKRAGTPVEQRFFPELALARTALDRLRASQGWLDAAGLTGFDCIALDEAQDLTPLETLLLIELARANRMGPNARVAFLAAGDEAQTVRPTDFEWGWFHDLLHMKLGSPADFELRANLRSPRQIAELVNRVWVLYGHIGKHERPSGSSRAELDDEAGDGVLFCAAAPGRELDDLLRAFSRREGLAIVNMGESVPAWVPEDLRQFITTPLDIKGLDFHSVCVFNGGAFLQRIQASERDHAISDLSRRVAIDQLRVAVSRPAERLYWLDVDPTGAALAASRELLSEWSLQKATPMAPEAVLRTLEEETLTLAERVRLCEADARQFVNVKPDIAYSRALQATMLVKLIVEGVDPALRRSAHLTFAEVAFLLAFRKATLSPQLGRPDLYAEASVQAAAAGDGWLANAIQAIGNAQKCADTPFALLHALHPFRDPSASIPGWLRIELRSLVPAWFEQIERMSQQAVSARSAAELIANLAKLAEMPDAAERGRRARGQAAKALLDAGMGRQALELIADAPDCDPLLRARAIELDGRPEEAAGAFLAAGSPADALRCYRLIPDFEKALELARESQTGAVTETLEWMDRMRRLAAERPASFSKTVLPSEKKLLEDILENALGATRRRPASKKAAAPRKTTAPGKSAAPRKRAPAAKKAPPKP